MATIVQALLTAAPLLATASTLSLSGDESIIRFGNAAVLSATCQGDSPYIEYVYPQRVTSQAAVSVMLSGVAPSCAGVPISKACAGMNDTVFRPAAWNCDWINAEGENWKAGPLHALRILEADAASGINLGWHVKLLCPVPPRTSPIYGSLEVLQLSHAANLTLAVSHGVPHAERVQVPFALPGGGDIRFMVPQGSHARGDGILGGYTAADGEPYITMTFVESGTFHWIRGEGEAADVLIVGGGGGGGGRHAGGGGGGGVVHLTGVTLEAGSYDVVVGVGGTGGYTSGTVGGVGGDSQFLGQTAKGGGGGGAYDADGKTCSTSRVGNKCLPSVGGSGGGAGSGDSGGAVSGGASIQPGIVGGYTGTTYGNKGGAGNGHANGAGGGGAGAAGEDESLASSAGDGGAGIMIDILGVNYYWAGGGGGADRNQKAGDGGIGGGGGGGVYPAGYSDGPGTPGNPTGNLMTALNLGQSGYNSQSGGHGGANTGGGGGGNSQDPSRNGDGRGGDGGSGIVIVRIHL